METADGMGDRRNVGVRHQQIIGKIINVIPPYTGATRSAIAIGWEPLKPGLFDYLGEDAKIIAETR